MDNNNKIASTDLNQHAANKVPKNAQDNKIPADKFRAVEEDQSKADAQHPGQTATNTSQHSNGGGSGK